MSWDKAKELAKQSGGLFLKLGDGDKKQIVLLGDPEGFYQIYSQGGSQEFSHKVPGSSFRFKVPVAVINGKEVEACIFSQGKTVFERLSYIHEEMGGLDDKIILIHRKGSTKDDTVYNIDVKGPVTPELKKIIDALEKPSLEKKEKDLPYSDTPHPGDDEVPF